MPSRFIVAGIRAVAIVALAAGVVWAAMTIDWSRLGATLATAPPIDLAAMIAAWLAALAFRPLRLLVLLRATGGYSGWDYPSVWIAHILAMAVNSIVPMRAGDVMAAVILRQRLGTSLPQAFSVILFDRVLDLGMVAALFLGVLMFVPALASWVPSAEMSLGVVLGIALAALGAIVALRERLLALLPRLLVRFDSARRERWEEVARDLFSGFAALSRPVSAPAVIGLSAGLWGLITLSYWFGLHAVWPEASFAAAGFTVGAVALSFIVPVAPAGIGVFHAAAIFALAAFGVPLEVALAFAIIAHASQLVTVYALAAVALLIKGGGLRSLLPPRPAQQ